MTLTPDMRLLDLINIITHVDFRLAFSSGAHQNIDHTCMLLSLKPRNSRMYQKPAD